MEATKQATPKSSRNSAANGDPQAPDGHAVAATPYALRQAHFEHLQAAAVFRLIYYLIRQESGDKDAAQRVFARFPCLLDSYQRLQAILPAEISWRAALRLAQQKADELAAGADCFLPLRAVESQTGLDHIAILGLMLAGVVEDSQPFCALFQTLQHPLNSRRPAVALLQEMLTDPADPASLANVRRSLHQLFDSGLIEVLNPAAPRAEWQIRVPPSIWDLLRGEGSPRLPEQFTWHDREQFPAIEALLLRLEDRARLGRIPLLLESEQARAFILRAMRGSERLQIAGAIARATGYNIISIAHPISPQDERWAMLGPMCTLTQSLPVFMLDLASGETIDLPQLSSYTGAVIVVLGKSGGVRGALVERAVSWSLPPSAPAERRLQWRKALGEEQTAALPEIARRYAIPGDYIRQTASGAINQARFEGAAAVQPSHVRAAARALNRQQLETLAQHLDAESMGGWDSLVVNPATANELQELERRCRHREVLQSKLGRAFSGNLNTGVRALFNGPSGTGKTLAARILAAELEMDLYRVDLSAVVNKYIGETEKNLHELFSRAEELDVILLLDEGDSLMANRTNVQSSNDRYANLETNYLLQRIETYSGILLITSNAGEHIDKAFKRRIDVNIDFFLPEADERLQIWRLHLPEKHDVEEHFLEHIASRCEMSGGQIRNAALYAACSALDEGADTIAARHVEMAIANEYRKAGSVSSLYPNNNDHAADGRLKRLLTVMQ